MIGFSKFWNRQGVAARASAQKLYSGLSAAALTAPLYEEGAAIDTFEGRAAMITAHAALVMRRLKSIEGHASRKIAERLNRLVLDGFDAAYREKGVGDSSIARKVRKLAEVHYGLGKSLTGALNAVATDQGESLTNCVTRNGLSEPGKESLLVDYLLHNARQFAQLNDKTVLSGELLWRHAGKD